MESNRPIEYIYKKSAYIFPAKSKIFVTGNKLSVEIFNKKVTNISKYLSKETAIEKNCLYKIGLPITGNGLQLLREYQTIADFFDKYTKLSFLQFDYATSNELALCIFFKSTSLIQSANLLQDIGREMPFLINILRRPLIHLKETDVLQPVDMVKRVNHNTIRHLSIHAENWKGVNGNTIVPAQLLTRVYEDDYSIYENVVFRDLIDKIMAVLRKRIYYLTEILNAFRESIQLDAVNRLNHRMYYLAIGKLYAGFSKTENSSELLAMLENTKALYKQLSKYTSRAVYIKNSNVKPVSGGVKKTNILTMHKDYKHVYSLYQKFNNCRPESPESGSFLSQSRSQQNYELFCQILVLFAATNFNMSCKTDGSIYENGKVNAAFKYKDWSLTVSCEYNAILDLNTVIMSTAHNNKCVKYMLIPMSYYITHDKKKRYEHIIERLYYSGSVYDKYIFLEPFDFDGNSQNNYCIKHPAADVNLFYSVLPVSISEINSFRRLQKLLFECMVLSNETCDICAFCGEKLIKETDNKYLCCKCRTAIKKIDCGHCNEAFTATYIDIPNRRHNGKEEIEDAYLKDLPDFYRQEKKHSFRNIVNINDSSFICPHCGGENKK